MSKINKIFATILIVSTTLVSADSGDKAQAQKFYDFLSNPGSTAAAKAFTQATHDDWQSIGNYSGKNKSRGAFIGQLKGFSKLIPDLKWAVESMHKDGNSIIVRGRATGTPKGPLFGVDGQGRSFDIMTIDIHELRDGLIQHTYHVEDWSTALRQLKGKNPKQQQGKQSLKIAQDFMEAMGGGDMEKMAALMSDDMVWLNEGDSNIPWIGPWKGKNEILGFLKVFSKNVKTVKWQTEDMIASGDTVAGFGKMKLLTTKSGKTTDEFNFALRIKVRDGKIILWNWFEDSFAVSNAYNDK